MKNVDNFILGFIAAVLGVAASVSLWLLDILSSLFGDTLRDVLSYLTPSGHYYNFVDGIIDTRDLAYYLSAIVVCLFLTSKILESKRWQG